MKLLLVLLVLLLVVLLLIPTSVLTNGSNRRRSGGHRRSRIINSLRCMTERNIALSPPSSPSSPSSPTTTTYILYNVRHGMLNADFTVSWFPATLYHLSNSTRDHSLLQQAARLRFYRTRAYLDNNIPLFYANLSKRYQC